MYMCKPLVDHSDVPVHLKTHCAPDYEVLRITLTSLALIHEVNTVPVKKKKI